MQEFIDKLLVCLILSFLVLITHLEIHHQQPEITHHYSNLPIKDKNHD